MGEETPPFLPMYTKAEHLLLVDALKFFLENQSFKDDQEREQFERLFEKVYNNTEWTAKP